MNFYKNDRVFIVGNDDDMVCIGGIHNFESDEALEENFGRKFNYCRCWDNSIIGRIREIGKNDFYVIEDLENPYKVYIYNNNYREMHKISELVTENKRLEKVELQLEALEAAGVDNWDGYGYAMELLDKLEKGEDI